MIPSPWVAAVLVLGAYRIVRLIGWDDLPPIYRLRARVTGERVRYNLVESRDPIFSYDRPLLAHFLACAYCQGFWVSTITYVAWYFEPTWTLTVLASFALAGAVGLLAKNLDA